MSPDTKPETSGDAKHEVLSVKDVQGLADAIEALNEALEAIRFATAPFTVDGKPSGVPPVLPPDAAKTTP